MPAPEIDSDSDDDAIPMPTPLPMTVAVYMEPTRPDNAHTVPEADRKFHEPSAMQRTVRGMSSSEYDIDAFESHVSRPRILSTHHASTGAGRGATPASTCELPRIPALSPDAPSTSSAGTTPLPIKSRNVEDMRGEPHAPHAGITPTAPMPATLADPHSVEPQSVRRQAQAARGAPAGKDGEPAAEDSKSDGVAHAPKGGATAKGRFELTYRFSSWGEDASVALKLEHMHPGAQVLVTPSNGQVHRILNAFLQRKSSEANSRSVLRLTDREDLSVEDSTKRGRKQQRHQN